MDNTATTTEPTPDGNGQDIARLVQEDLRREGGFPRVEADIEARAEMGEEKYGERLQAENGRDPIKDAYQETLDQIMYLRQAMAEGTREVGQFYYPAIRTARHLRRMISDR